ncbi:MAG: hypothetical protein HC814_02695 [Rhodobacteraceae bacterium]|nr:hypothetical protein [Paracoccaceae bacterium]
MIVLATTSEIDDKTFRYLQPALSRAYLLEADSAMTTVTEQSLAGQASLFQAADLLVNR